jgi:hypothetical protein
MKFLEELFSSFMRNLTKEVRVCSGVTTITLVSLFSLPYFLKEGIVRLKAFGKKHLSY